jgi:DNA-directed RNA polymerase subunit L
MDHFLESPSFRTKTATDVPRALRHALRKSFADRGLQAFIGIDVPIVYDETHALTSDLAVVLHADERPRRAWIAAIERRTPDLIVQVVAGADRVQALDRAARHVALGAQEAFVFDRIHGAIAGFRSAGGRTEPVPRDARGAVRSRAIDAELVPRGDRIDLVRFASDRELLGVLDRLDRALDRIQARRLGSFVA